MREFLEWAKPLIKRLRDLSFFLNDPLSFVLVLITFPILTKIWGFKKAFSYYLVVFVILFSVSKIILLIQQPINDLGINSTDIVRLLTFFILALISIYYAMIKND